MYGFRQLREIAVKALSPGINDPGVAILCVEHLAELLSRSVGRKAEYAIAGGDGHPRIFLKEYDIHALLDMSLLPILTYGRRDDAVLNALLSSVYQLAQNEKAGPLRRHLEKLADAIICAADESVRGEIQRTLLASRVDEIRKTGYLDFRAELRKLPDASPDH